MRQRRSRSSRPRFRFRSILGILLAIGTAAAGAWWLTAYRGDPHAPVPGRDASLPLDSVNGPGHLKPVVGSAQENASTAKLRSGLGFPVHATADSTYLLTAAHVVQGCGLVAIQSIMGGDRTKATVQELDVANDLALLAVPVRFESVSEFSERDPALPEGTIYYGRPDGQKSAKTGRVVALHGPGEDARLQTFIGVGVDLGDSGSAVLDSTGRVVGLLVGEATRKNDGIVSRLGFALKTEMLQLFLEAQNIPYSKSLSRAEARLDDPDALLKQQTVKVVCAELPAEKVFSERPELLESTRDYCARIMSNDTARLRKCIKSNSDAYDRLQKHMKDSRIGTLEHAALRQCYTQMRSVLEADDYVEWLKCFDRQIDNSLPVNLKR
ncbi:MAG: serine protease [Alphaproteobacteria bacterium]